jgi:hypothetical protein
MEDAATWRGIPVTTVPRTLVDLAAVLNEDDLARACHEAEVRHGTGPALVEAVLARRPNAPGAKKLRANVFESPGLMLVELRALLTPRGRPKDAGALRSPLSRVLGR